MATLKEIRNRIGSIKSIQQITKAMKMVAAAKLRRSQERMFAARPYAQKIDELIRRLMLGFDEVDEPLLEERHVRKIKLILVTSDKGLCGAFNTHLIKRALIEIDASRDCEIEMLCIGKKGLDFFKKQDMGLVKGYADIFRDLQFHQAEEIVGDLTTEFLEQKTDKIKLIYNQFKSVVQQNLIVEDFLPLKRKNIEEQKTIDYLYEPSLKELIRVLIPKHLKMQIWRALLESYAAEQGARMTAMENATENANELIHDLTLQYNKARQASITKEILEIIGGAEAIRKAS